MRECADLTAAPPPAGAFDLVPAHRFPAPRRCGDTRAAGAPGGTLPVAGHDLTDTPPGPERGFDPGDYSRPGDVARPLDGDWAVPVDETRPRAAPAPAGTRRSHDTVLRARRLR